MKSIRVHWGSYSTALYSLLLPELPGAPAAMDRPSQIYLHLVVIKRKDFEQIREETWWRLPESKYREYFDDAVASICFQEYPGVRR